MLASYNLANGTDYFVSDPSEDVSMDVVAKSSSGAFQDQGFEVTVVDDTFWEQLARTGRYRNRESEADWLKRILAEVKKRKFRHYDPRFQGRNVLVLVDMGLTLESNLALLVRNYSSTLAASGFKQIWWVNPTSTIRTRLWPPPT